MYIIICVFVISIRTKKICVKKQKNPNLLENQKNPNLLETQKI